MSFEFPNSRRWNDFSQRVVYNEILKKQVGEFALTENGVCFGAVLSWIDAMLKGEGHLKLLTKNKEAVIKA